MASNPTVSVCVANYNGVGVIEDCLNSIYRQQTEAEVEIIVHDDASCDQSLALIQSTFPQVVVIASSENVGFCVANNRMVKQAAGRFVLLLNNDAWLDADAIETFLRAVKSRGDEVFTLPQYDAETGTLLDCGMFMDVFANPIGVDEVREQPVAMVMGACLWVSRDLWNDCGGFPEWFGSMAEDMYLCHYARLLGRDVVALAGSAYHHHVGHSFGGGKVQASGLVTTINRRRLSERNKLYVMFLFYPWPVLLLILPIHLLGLLLEGVLLALVKRQPSLFTRIYGHALGAFVGNFAQLWRRRASIQARRVVGWRQFLVVYRWTPHKLRMFLRHGLPSLS